MMLDDLDEEKSLGDKIIRAVVFLFLTVLVSMLIITLLPGDAEQSFFKFITGQDNYSAGKIGDSNIPIDYYQAARKDCYYRYKTYSPDMANDEEITKCAYETVKFLKINRVLSESVGYSISEQKAKEEIYLQAKDAHQQSSVGAGYSDDEKVSLEDIYKNILRATPMPYRLDYMIAMNTDRFLLSNVKETESEKSIKNQSNNARISINYIVFTDLDIIGKVDDNLPISEEEINKVYKESVDSGSLKSIDGKIPTIEERRDLIVNTLRSEKKQNILLEIKSKMQSIKDQKGQLKEISELSGQKINEINNLSLANISDMIEQNKNINFMQTKAFLKDLGDVPFGVGKIGGPYPDGNKIVYVEFKDLKFENSNNKNDESDGRYQIVINYFFSDINKSLTGMYPVQKKFFK
jgi:hypothetical protein